MFKRFNRDTEGTGIGLYIIKRVAEKYGGAAWVESKTGKGSAFTVKIPAEVVRRDISAST
jgi:signal transduction histidine kinase